MRALSPLSTSVAIAVITACLSACAGTSEDGPTILAGADRTTGAAQSGSSDSRLGAIYDEGSLLLPYRAPPSGGVAYRLTLEIEGERAARSPYNAKQPPVREAHSLLVEFRKLPVEAADSKDDMFLVGLDGLLYTQKQQNPQIERVVELAEDRLRIKVNGETSVDNRGNRVVGKLAPRAFLNRIFGVFTHDPSGNPIKLSSRGTPAAREFMNSIPILGAIAYTMVTLPEDPITPGSKWFGVRLPSSRSGELGLSLTIDYTLEGFEIFEDVPCAIIQLNAHIDEYAFTGITGLKFDKVQATLNGTAWVELENSLVRRVVLSDQIRATWTSPGDPKTASEHRIQHTSKLELTLRDPKRKTKKWSNGTPRFESN